MIGFIEGIFTLVSFLLSTATWIFIVSLISFYLGLILKSCNIRPKPLEYSIVVGIILEVLLSIISLSLTGQSPVPGKINTGVLSVFQKGWYFTALLSPVSSIAGAIIGIRKRRRPRRFF